MSESLKLKAYRVIRARVISGELPVGSKFSEIALARELGTSSAPVREAVVQLVGEGLLEFTPGYGATVKKPSPTDMVELGDLRQAIESFAAERAATRLSEDRLRELSDCCRQYYLALREIRRSRPDNLPVDQIKKTHASDLAFHAIILEVGGNPRMTALYSQFHIMDTLWRSLLPRDSVLARPDLRRGMVLAHLEHRRILAALKRRDPDLARRRMSDHISASTRRQVSWVDPHFGAQSNIFQRNPTLEGLLPSGAAYRSPTTQ